MTSTTGPPPQALRLTIDEAKANTYEKSGGIMTSLFAARNLSLIPTIPENSIIHDNACGTGVVSRLLLAQRKDIKIHATDVDAPFLSALSSDVEKNGWPIEVTNQKCEALGFADNYFDYSVTNCAIFMTGLDGAKEIYRTLKPGGTAVVNCWAYVAWYEPVKSAHEHTRPGKPWPEFGPLEAWIDGSRIQNVMKEAGFKEDNMRVERIDEWAIVKRTDLKEWAEGIWSWFGAVPGWNGSDEEKWDEAVDKLVEQLLVHPGAEVVGDEVRLKGGQWVAIAKK